MVTYYRPRVYVLKDTKEVFKKAIEYVCHGYNTLEYNNIDNMCTHNMDSEQMKELSSMFPAIDIYITIESDCSSHTAIYHLKDGKRDYLGEVKMVEDFLARYPDVEHIPIEGGNKIWTRQMIKEQEDVQRRRENHKMGTMN